ncbi:DUF234 domain-containing protein [Sulfurovum sp. bin170]|uniref:DUF234 domain-containing protein n=1 Tax=Sulfurovum sp. bin170 TaxID=2695268 RepID=UPI0013DEF8FF|nr:DUF234 domain-containing protein [Sulfurovum sp. bin170]NEW60587.1 DUF234 domain-containing protein [Sulfurovum sp. bin170]
MELEHAMELFAVFGGIECDIELDFLDDLELLIRFSFVERYLEFSNLISPSYLLEEPYRYILISIARGDGRLTNVFRKARVGDTLGMSIVNQLIELGIVELEESREAPLKKYPNQKLEKSLRSYKIEAKIRFKQPFYRFWFGFVEPYSKDLSQNRSQRFFENFEQHFSRLNSLVFEQLSNELLNQHYNDKLKSMGSYWDVNSEFDILAKTTRGETVVGECKYKNRRVCKSELTKLKQKAEVSGLKADTYALFSKSGFSNELLNSEDEDLILFELEDFRKLL